MRLVVWNAQWARGDRARRTRATLEGLAADVIVATEVCPGALPDGFVVESEADYGYPVHPGRRKAVLWSREPFEASDRVGNLDLPPGRFARARTRTPVGTMDIVGVCIPWRDAHISTGRRDRRPWEDHDAYLRALRPILDGLGEDGLGVVAGDFNQRVPRARQPERVADLLCDMLSRYELVTSGLGLIDHVAVAPPLRATRVEIVSGRESRLSDHDGVLVELTTTVRGAA